MSKRFARSPMASGARPMPRSRTVTRAPDASAASPQVILHGIGLAIVRIAIGFLWYTQLFWKYPPGFSALHSYVVKEASYSWLAPYQSLVRAVVLPNFTAVAYLTFLIESLIAISLLFGILARLGALLGTLWAAQLFVGLAYAPGEWYWTYGMLVLLNGVLVLVPAGRYLSIDQWLRPRLAAAAARGSRAARYLCLAE